MIQCEAHVRVRIKRIFGAVHQGRDLDFERRPVETIRFAATDENSRELEWFLSRYPMEVNDGSELTRRARAYDDLVALSTKIIEGDYEAPDVTDMALPPREYQLRAAALVLANGYLLLADDLGLGKTVVGLTVLSNLGTLPAIVVCPGHLQRQWQRECAKFLPSLRTHIVKKRKPYSFSKYGGRPDVLIVTYHKLSGWADHLVGHYKTAIFDEAQDLRRSVSKKYDACAVIGRNAEYVMELTATPIYNYGGEFYNLISVLNDGILGTRDEFCREWCLSGQSDDKAIIADPEAFGTYLRESAIMVRRTRKDVAKELPPVSTVLHEIDADPAALDKIKDTAVELAKIILTQKGGWDIMKASSELSNSLRQATGIAKAPYVAAFVRMLLEQSEDSIVLFGWHREVYNIWGAILKEFSPAWYTGSETVSRKDKEFQRFLRGDTRLLIMSLRSGVGVDGLQEVSATAVFGELDWSPGVLEQCVGRLDRDGQPSPVFAYYLTATTGADPIMVDVLGLKRSQIEGVRDPGAPRSIMKTVDPNHIKRLAAAYLKGVGK